MTQRHGGDIYAYEAAYGARPLDFSANINPLGMPEGAMDAARDALADAVHYPDPACTALRAALSRHEGVSASRILCGPGSADLIYRFAYAIRPRYALVCAPSFGEYTRALTAAGTGIVSQRLTEADGFRLTEAVLPALDRVQAVCLCTPNNPTGLTIEPALLTRVLDACAQRDVYVLLDEAFVDFLDEPSLHTRVSALSGHPRLVVLKAFTKFYGLPGLRLGYAMCADEALLARMKAAGPPWGVSGPAQAAGIAALADHGYAAKARALIQTERAFLGQMLLRMGLAPIGEANFLLFKGPSGLAEALCNEGVLVRNCASFDGLDEDWVRIAVRGREENTRLLSRLSRCLHG